ncbi:MAG TPA: lipopolysaccharide heptosyltransferase II [Blastocatellia bacterium]|nr:lipopolysaccharide heptosyltransferase II [Blastocatellia bacterium]
MKSRATQMLKRAIRGPGEALLKVYLATHPGGDLVTEQVSRILVFAYHGLGNFIMYTPALRLLRERYPEARIDLQVGNKTGCEEVIAGAGLFDNVYNLPYSAGLRAWMARAREIRETAYDVTINEFHSHSWQLALLVSASGARHRAGHITSPGWPAEFSRYGFVFSIGVVMREDEHEIERYQDLVASVGAQRALPGEVPTFIHLDDQDREFARHFLDDRENNSNGKIIGFQPGSSPTMSWKQWPIDRYRKVIGRLMTDAPGSRIVLFGSASEEEMIRGMAEGLGPRVTVAAGKTSVKQAAALIERCDLLVCNDSGLMHAAVAVGTPVVAIYGPTDYRRTAPLGPLHRIIRHELPCSPCFKLDGDEQVHLCPHHDCLMTIGAEEVLEAISQTPGASPFVQHAGETPGGGR